MKLMIYNKNKEWVDFEEQANCILTDDLDGYSGSEKTAFLKLKKEESDPVLNNLSLRFVHVFNEEEIPLTKLNETEKVEISSGDPILKNKVMYSIKTNIDLENSQNGTDIFPDENGMFLLTNSLEDEVEFSIKTKVLPRVITDFSQKVNLSDIYIQLYFSE